MSGDRHWAVVGAGSMGSVVGAYLALAGHRVTLVDVDRAHVDAVQRSGLAVRRSPDADDVVVPVAATTDPTAELHGVDVAIFLCKGWATADAARSVAHALAADGWAISLQNGLGNDQRLAEVLGGSRAVPGTTTIGATTDGPGRVATSAGTALGQSLTQLGPPVASVEVPPGLVEVADAMTAAGLPTEVLADADRVIWTKLAMAASMACLTGLLRRTVADVVGDEWAWDLWNDMFDEVMAVAVAKGIALDVAAIRAHSEATYRSVGPHVTSMAADVIGRRRTEVDTLALELTRQADELGVPVPVTRTVARLVMALERTYPPAPIHPSTP